MASNHASFNTLNYNQARGHFVCGLFPQYFQVLFPIVAKMSRPDLLDDDNNRLRLPPASPPHKDEVKKRINGGRHATVKLIIQPLPQRCALCRRCIGTEKAA
jgi:hypothetical protein